MNKQEIVAAGWVFGNSDGFVGERIYPSWQGMLEGKRLVLRDIRLLNGCFFVHDPWRNVAHESFETLAEVEAHILSHGRVIEVGENVWD